MAIWIRAAGAWSLSLVAFALLSACAGEQVQPDVMARSCDEAWVDEAWVDESVEGLPLRWREAHHGVSSGPARALRIYIGGDGRPWQGSRPATRPDATRPLALALFDADPDADVYLGRPCYHFSRLPAVCEPKWWTSHRYGPEVVEALMSAVDVLRLQYSRATVELVGYSGGGTLALLLAARSPTITRVLTVAPNVDTTAWAEFHGLLPLHGSLNPAEQRSPQADCVDHLFGERDQVVPPALARSYLQRHPEHGVHVVERFDHRCCWAAHWTELLRRTLSRCRVGNEEPAGL